MALGRAADGRFDSTRKRPSTHARYRVTHKRAGSPVARHVHSHHGHDLEAAIDRCASIPSDEEPLVEMGIEPWDTGETSSTTWTPLQNAFES